jgi:hypothetical protein
MNNKLGKTAVQMAVVALSLLAIFGLRAWYRHSTDCQYGKLPLRSFFVNVDAVQHEELIHQAQEYAVKHDFKFDVVYYTPNQDQFLVNLTRKDVQIIISNPFKSGEFKIGLYNNDCLHPAQVSDINGFVQDLQTSINKIPDATFSEEK